jgi:hypothetical protein
MDFHMLLLPLPLGFVCLFLFWHQRLEPSIDVVSESNLESFFYETVYDATSTIDYLKEPLDAGVVDRPRPSKYSDNRPLRHHSRASIATLSSRLPLNQTEYYTSTTAMYGRATYKECIPTYSFAGRFAPPREFGCKCPSCQGKPPLPWVYHTLQSFYP